jgi:hypothetical protein
MRRSIWRAFDYVRVNRLPLYGREPSRTDLIWETNRFVVRASNELVAAGSRIESASRHQVVSSDAANSHDDRRIEHADAASD